MQGRLLPIDWSTVVWHPILSAQEVTPGRWVMIDGLERPHAMVQLVRRGNELGYRVTTWAPDDDEKSVDIMDTHGDGRLIGYYRTLMAATKAAHMRMVRSLGNPGPPIANWGDPEKVGR